MSGDPGARARARAAETSFIGGQSFVSSAPVFSNDAKRLLVCTGNTVSIFSTDTGMLVAELEGHTDLVTSIGVIPVADSNARKFMCYCWTSSLDGTIRKWDFLTPEMVKKIDVKLPIFSMVLPHISNIQSDNSEKLLNIYAFISVENINKSDDRSKVLRGQIQIYNLSNGTHVRGLLAETRKPEIIFMGGYGKYIGIRDKHKLGIWKIPSYKEFKFDAIKKIKLHHTKKLSVLAFHPSESIVAGGDVTGKILIWRGVGKRKFSDNFSKTSLKSKDKDGKPGVRGDDDADSCTTWHWHPSGVQILFFSSDGAYLYSGGKEGVLVVWQLDTGKKKFKPRLGSPLLYYTHSPDPSLSCVSCADNQIHLLKMPSMEIVKTVAGIKLPFSLPNKCKRLCNDFAFDNNAGLIALPTSDYCIQFFNLFENIEVSQVQVCERNFQPVDDLTIYVALTTLSMDGSMMGTVDVRLPEEGLGGRVTLKFWTRGSQDGNYELVTVIYEPHSDAQISSIAFRPGHAMAVSTSVGGEFKIWVHYNNDPLKYQKKSGWRCQSVGSYKKIPMTAAAFSSDGSVLAVATETIITLWDPETNALVAVIGDTLSPITTLCFTGNSKYVVASSGDSNPQLAVWDLSSLSMFWSYKLWAEAIACSEDGSQIGVLVLANPSDTEVEDGVILLFDVQNPVSKATWMVKKAKGGGLAFVSSDTYREHVKVDADESVGPQLVYINSNHEYVMFDPRNSKENQITRNAHKFHLPADEQERVGYTSVYGKLRDSKKEQMQIGDIPYVPSSKSPWEAIFSSSSHLLPSIAELSSNFLESLLENKPIMA